MDLWLLWLVNLWSLHQDVSKSFWSVFLCLFWILVIVRLHCDLFACRCTEQPSSSMSLSQRRICLSVSVRSSAWQALIWGLMGAGVFTATRASVCSPTGLSSSPSGAFSLSSTDTPSLAHMPCLLKSKICFHSLCWCLSVPLLQMSLSCPYCLVESFLFYLQAHLSLHAKCAIPLDSETTHPRAGELKMWNCPQIWMLASFCLTKMYLIPL